MGLNGSGAMKRWGLWLSERGNEEGRCERVLGRHPRKTKRARKLRCLVGRDQSNYIFEGSRQNLCEGGVVEEEPQGRRVLGQHYREKRGIVSIGDTSAGGRGLPREAGGKKEWILKTAHRGVLI